MLINTLLETLGVTRTRLASMLVHFVYDGVYATKEERVSGGGSLELKKKVAQTSEKTSSIVRIQPSLHTQ